VKVKFADHVEPKDHANVWRVLPLRQGASHNLQLQSCHLARLMEPLLFELSEDDGVKKIRLVSDDE
jgi:hypothetical protein